MPSVSLAIVAFLLATATLAAELCLGERSDVSRSDQKLCRSGYWAEIKALDDCRFTFAAGLSPTASRKASPQPAKFRVNGGRCQRWPNRPLTEAGASVLCARSGSESVTVTLETTAAVLKKVLAPLPARVPEEPVLEKRRSPPQTEVLTLYRSRDYRPMEYGRGCPACQLFAADIRPTQPGSIILDVAVVSTSGSGHWFRCPAAFRCGVPEFSPTDQPQASGCAGELACRVWRLSDDASEARDTVQITYQTDSAACKNCPPGVDYPSARKRWEEAKAQAARACRSFPDEPVQVLGRQPAR